MEIQKKMHPYNTTEPENLEKIYGDHYCYKLKTLQFFVKSLSDHFFYF